MTWLSLLLLLVSLVTFVTGQLLLKRAMESSVTAGFRQRTFGWFMFGGVLAQAVSFFLTLGLLQRFDLSYLYPFQGVSVVFVIAAAALFLREKITLPLALGSLLIAAGVVLVAVS
ncbi:MAG: EamA family transporter [Chthoniobacterales bacterium]